MAENGGKPNNELFELNDLLAGVEPSEESWRTSWWRSTAKPERPIPPSSDAPQEPPPEEAGPG